MAEPYFITEYFLPFVAFGDKVSPNQLKPKNGYIELPTAPGLGVEIDEQALARHPNQAVSAAQAAYACRRGPLRTRSDIMSVLLGSETRKVLSRVD